MLTCFLGELLLHKSAPRGEATPHLISLLHKSADMSSVNYMQLSRHVIKSAAQDVPHFN